VQPQLSIGGKALQKSIPFSVDLAKQGYIQYDTALVQNGFQSFGGILNGWALFPTIVGAYSALPGGSRFKESYGLVTFPMGAHPAVTYQVGAGCIRKTSENPQACYRRLNLISKHPELFDAMPMRRSLFGQVAADSQTIALFNYFDGCFRIQTRLCCSQPLAEVPI
jgi:hypothetical protein